MANQESTSIFRLRATGVVYETGMMAPKVLIHARGLRAQRMISIAREKGVPVVVNPDLSVALSLVPENFEIPEELYQVMANLLIHVAKVGLEK